MRLRSLMLAALCALSVSRGALLPCVAEPVETESRVVAVTVYADRARTRRTTPVQLLKGAQTFLFRQLPGWVDERSVRVEVIPPDAGQVAGVRMSRVFLSETTDAQYREAENAFLETQDQLNALEDERAVLEVQAEQVRSVRTFATEKLSLDALQRAITAADYRAEADYVTETLRAVAVARRELERTKRSLLPELQARQRRLNEVKSLRQLQQTEVAVDLQGVRAGAATLALTYLLPGATWSPAHDLRAEAPDAELVELSSYAVVTQTTGEDWSDAELSFSTQSPTSTMTIPELEALVLGTSRVSSLQQGTPEQAFQVAQQLFEGQNDLYNSVLNKFDINDLSRNRMEQFQVQQRMGAVFERLRDRGTTAHFSATTRVAVRSDGRAVRVPIGQRRLAAQARVVVAPQASLNAARTVKLTNGDTASPLLPGPVGLYLAGSYLGPTEVDFVAPGETFAVFMGVEDALKVQRVMDLEKSSLTRGRRTRMSVHFDISLENLGGAPLQVDLSDRIPVSEKSDIRVERVRLDPKTEPESDGLLRWVMTLEPGETRAVTVGYTINYPPEVVETMRKQKGLSSAMPSAAIDLSVQIESLESRF